MDWIIAGMFVGGLLTGILFGFAAANQATLWTYSRSPKTVLDWLERNT